MSEQELQFCANLFEGFVHDDEVTVVFGGVSTTFDRKTIGVEFCGHFGLAVAREKAQAIKVRLKGKDDLFWRYAAAMGFFYGHKKDVAWYDQWKEIESACKQFLKCKIQTNEFKRIISKMPDDKSYPPFDLHKNHLIGQLRAFFGKSWRHSYPFPLRDAIYDAVEILYSTYMETFWNKSKNPQKGNLILEEPKYKKIFEEVYEHLQLFGISLDSPDVIENIYYRH